MAANMGGLTVLGEGLELGVKGVKRDAQVLHQGPVPDGYAVPIHLCPYPLTWLHFEVCGLGEGEATVYGGGSNGAGHGMLGGALGGGR